MNDVFPIELKYTITARVNLRRAFGKIADKHPLGASSKYIAEPPYRAPNKWVHSGVYHFKGGGRKFDGKEQFVSDLEKARVANELFRDADRALKRLDKKYHKIYGHGRFDNVEMMITVGPGGKVEMNVFDVIEGLISMLSDDNGEEEEIKEMLEELERLLKRID